MASINSLKAMASSKLGFARTNTFLVELPRLPGNSSVFGGLVGELIDPFIPDVPGINSVGRPSAEAEAEGRIPGTSELNVLCKNATLPGRQILTHDRRIGMVNEKVAYGYAVTEVSLTFYVLNNYGVKNYFDDWMRRAVDPVKHAVNYKSEYAYPVKIHQLRRPQIQTSASAAPIIIEAGGGTVYSVRLDGAFPVTINQIDFSNNLDELVELTVSLSYTNWTRIYPSQNFIGANLSI